MIEILAIILLSGLISADRFVAFNIMISRPMALSIIVGLLTGKVQECFYIGLIFELIGIIDVPVGTRIPKDDTFASYTACLLVSYVTPPNAAGYALAVLLTLLIMVPVTYSCQIGRRLNKKFYLREIQKPEFNTGKLIAAGFTVAFVRWVVLYNAGALATIFLYSELATYLEHFHSYYYFITFIVIFLSGYLLRFLSVRSVLKYALFAGGVAAGWVLF